MKANPQILQMKQLLHELDFIAIDFETATHLPSSACSLGIAAVKTRCVVGSAHMLIRPPLNEYNYFNIGIHGITPKDTKHAPSFWQLWPQLAPLFGVCPVLAHNARFDMSVLLGSIGEHVPRLVPDFTYYDTLQMVKGIVPGNRNLAACSAHFGIRLDHHHNAQADAIACAEIAIACLNHLAAETLREFSQAAPGTKPYRFYDLKLGPGREAQSSPSKKAYPSPVNPRDIVSAKTAFDCRHPLFQKSIVFTGELSIARREAMQLAVDVGAVVHANLLKTTDYLVVGAQNLSLVGGDGHSSKERKALAMLQAGDSKLRMIHEAEFLALVANEGDPS